MASPWRADGSVAEGCASSYAPGCLSCSPVRTTRWLVLWVSTLVGILAGACGVGSDSASRDGAATGASGEASAALRVVGSAAAEPRKVVYTANLVVRVSSVEKAAARAAEEAEEAEGFVFSQNSDESTHDAQLILKVPSDRFDSVVAAVASWGRELRRNVKAQDVTSEVVDVEGRLKTAQASADRLRSLLGEARSAADVVAVEGELAKRETEIESLQGRLRVLTDQVELATLTVRLTERDDLRVNDDLPGFLEGLRAGWVALVNTALVLLTVAGFAVPFLPVVALLVWLVRRWRRRHPKRPRPPVPATWPAASAPQPPPA